MKSAKVLMIEENDSTKTPDCKICSSKVDIRELYRCVQCPLLLMCAKCGRDNAHAQHCVMRVPSVQAYKTLEFIFDMLSDEVNNRLGTNTNNCAEKDDDYSSDEDFSKRSNLQIPEETIEVLPEIKTDSLPSPCTGQKRKGPEPTIPAKKAARPDSPTIETNTVELNGLEEKAKKRTLNKERNNIENNTDEFDSASNNIEEQELGKEITNKS